MDQKIIERILSKVKIPNLVKLLVDQLSFSELQTLLLKIIELKSEKKEYVDLLNEFKSNKFANPSDVNPLVHRRLELDIFSLLPDDFELIDLSPMTPLGTSSVLATVHQNNVISTIRNLEVASDTTNILSLECAKRRNELFKRNPKSNRAIKLCSSQRCTRAQPFENKNFSACFNVAALCTAGRDEGNDRFEIINLEEHILFYLRLIEELIDNSEVKKVNIKFFEYDLADNSKLIENIKIKLSDKKNVDYIMETNSLFGKNYYTRMRFMIGVVNQQNQEFDYIDGGFTDWTSKLLNNNKERLLTSGISTDFLLRTIKYKFINTNHYV